MRYLYHLTEGNRGPVTFEQLQELAKAGTIDNMTPILAEGSREWSRWLFVKDTPQKASAPAAKPAVAPQTSAAEKTAPAVKPVSIPAQKKEEKKPEPKPVPAPTPAPVEQKPASAAESPKPISSKPSEPDNPAEESKPAAVEAKAEPESVAKPVKQNENAEPAAASAPVAEKPETPAFSLSAVVSELNLKQLIPAGISAVVTLLSLMAACVWTLMAHDTETEYAQLQDMAAEHEQSRQSLDNLSASRQQVQAETLKLNEDYRRMQETLKLTQEESGRLAKGPYISEAEAKQLKDEQAKAARLKEQEQKL